MLEKENTNHPVPTDCGAPPDVAGQARAEAIATICQNREETNRQLIRFYEKMYDDLIDAQRRHRAPELPLLPELPEFQTD